MITRAMRWTYALYAWLILAAVVVQFFLAGLGVFAGAENFQLHRDFGYNIFFIMVIGLLPALAARLPWQTIGLTALLPVLVGLQSVLITAWHSGLLVVAALHPVNGLAIFGLAGFLALRSRQYLPARTPTFAQVGKAEH
jgi:hypothetical protein